MSGMVVERAENPNPMGAKLGSRGFWVEQMPKGKENRATNALLQERFPI
jgi:hypothetical protein